MTLQRKSFRVLVGAALLALTAGCSGVHASKSVSPLDFLIPGGGGLMRGLLYHQPQPATPPTTEVEPGTPTPAPASVATAAPVS